MYIFEVRLKYRPFCLVDLFKEVKHKKADGQNFTDQTQAIRSATVLRWIVKRRAVDKGVR